MDTAETVDYWKRMLAVAQGFAKSENYDEAVARTQTVIGKLSALCKKAERRDTRELSELLSGAKVHLVRYKELQAESTREALARQKQYRDNQRKELAVDEDSPQLT